MATLQRILTASRYEGLFFLGGLIMAAVNLFVMVSYESLTADSQCAGSFPFIGINAIAFALGTAMSNWGFYKANR